MSRFNEPRPADVFPQPGAFPGPYQERPAYSKAAVAGFVCSLLALPFVTQLLGLIFGLIGVFATRGRRLRGKGLAIAGIVISLLVATVWAAVLSFTVLLSRALNASDRQFFAVLKAPGSELDSHLASLYDDRFSEPFQSRLSRDEFARWAHAVQSKHGQLQAVKRDGRTPFETLDGGGVKLNYLGEFINGPAVISITYLSLATDQARFDDLAVDGVSPSGARKPAPAEHDPG